MELRVLPHPHDDFPTGVRTVNSLTLSGEQHENGAEPHSHVACPHHDWKICARRGARKGRHLDRAGAIEFLVPGRIRGRAMIGKTSGRFARRAFALAAATCLTVLT